MGAPISDKRFAIRVITSAALFVAVLLLSIVAAASARRSICRRSVLLRFPWAIRADGDGPEGSHVPHRAHA